MSPSLHAFGRSALSRPLALHTLQKPNVAYGLVLLMLRRPLTVRFLHAKHAENADCLTGRASLAFPVRVKVKFKINQSA